MKKFFTFIAVAAMAIAAQAGSLTICNGLNYSNCSPLCGLYADAVGTMTQTIYPATMLEEMAGSEINQVTFYTLADYYEQQGQTSDDPTDYIYFDGAEFQLALLEVDQLGFTEAVAVVGATAVATTVPESGDIEVVFQLDEPFMYNGGNLLVEVTCIETQGEWGQTYFLGDGVEGYDCAYYFINGEGMTSAYLPKVTFDYEAVEENPYAEGYWMVMMDMAGEPHYYQLMPGSNGDYTTTVALNYDVFGTFDPATEERPVVPFYFLVDGVRYGSEADFTATVLGTALSNPLAQADGFYTVPVGYNYNMGIAFGNNDDMYVYAAQAGFTGIDEINAKAVAGVRYFNMAGQEMQQAQGLTIVVTTYTDGTSSAVKVVK